jgi:DNA-binding CsgD family transcriptional regulator
MAEREELSRLIGEVYDAALEPQLWPDVLGSATRFVGGRCAGLLSQNTASKYAQALFTYGVDSHYIQTYQEEYAIIDLTTTALSLFDIERIISVNDVMPYDEFLESRIYNEWARPQGLVDSAKVTLERSATSSAFLSIMRSEACGLVDEEMRRRMQLIVPHMRRSVLIGNVIDFKTAEADMLAATFDGLRTSIFLVDTLGRIIHANSSGHTLTGKADALRTVRGKLTALDARAEHQLNEIYAIARGGDAAVGTKGIDVPLLTPDREHYIAHVLPLTSGARRRAAAASGAVAAVFVRKAVLQTSSALGVIGKTYRLTPTELRVLGAVVEIGGAPEVADALGVTTNTVKTHLQRLFDKTGTSRQADLVKLVAGFASPLME